MFVCLLDELIIGFSYSDLTWETGGFELASTITLVLEANRLTKCASHPQSPPIPEFNVAIEILPSDPLWYAITENWNISRVEFLSIHCVLVR